jgi:uncharacterized membrane protein
MVAATGRNSPIRSRPVAHEMPSRASPTFPRGSDEFTRVLTFSDGLFAISMTLLVVGIGVPELGAQGGDERALIDALGDLLPEIVSFVISFAVIGRYWLAHHGTFARLAAMDYGLIAWNLLYLAFIAFLPSPPRCSAAISKTPSRWRSTACSPGW